MNFWDYFWTIRVEFAGLFWDSSNKIFRTVFGQSRTVLRFGFDLETDVFGFIFHLEVILVLVEHLGPFGWCLENKINTFFGFAYVIVPVKPPTLEDHNFFVRTPILVFLDSTESPLSIESGHILVNGIWGPNMFLKILIVALGVQVSWL